MPGSSRESISLPHESTWLVDEGEVEWRQVERPSGLPPIELLSITEVGEVLVVCECVEPFRSTFEEMLPLLQCSHDGKHLFVMGGIVLLDVCEALRHETHWMEMTIILKLRQNGACSIVQCITFQAKFAQIRRDDKNRGRGDGMFQGFECIFFGFAPRLPF